MSIANMITHVVWFSRKHALLGPTDIALAIILSVTPAVASMAADSQNQLVSVNLAGAGGGVGGGADYTISADGRLVAFTSGAGDLVTNDTNGGSVGR